MELSAVGVFDWMIDEGVADAGRAGTSAVGAVSEVSRGRWHLLVTGGTVVVSSLSSHGSGDLLVLGRRAAGAASPEFGDLGLLTLLWEADALESALSRQARGEADPRELLRTFPSVAACGDVVYTLQRSADRTTLSVTLDGRTLSERCVRLLDRHG